MDKAITAMIAPMKSDGAADFDAFGRLLDFQKENGISTVVVNGSTGEEKLLDEKTKRQLLKIAVKRMDCVIAGIGGLTADEVAGNAKTARRLGAKSVLLTPAEYIKQTKFALIERYEAVQKIMPTIVYDIKGRTGRQITDDEFAELIKMPNVIGVKAAGGDICQIGRVIRLARNAYRLGDKRIWVWSGDDNLTTRVREAGGDGVVSVVSNFAPKEVRTLCESDDADEIKRADELLKPLIEAAFSENNPAGIKRIMFAAGLIPTDRASDAVGRLANANMNLCDIAARAYKALR